MAFNVVDMKNSEGSILKDRLRGGFVALFGSFISYLHPSQLPTGEALTDSLAKLISKPISDPDGIAAAIRRSAFEHVLEGCEKSEVIADNLVSLFSPTNPNDLHKAVAELISSGVIQHVITTNYDTNLETACRSICAAPPQVVVTEEHTKYIDQTKPIIFKIHGCAAFDRNRPAGTDRSIAFSLAHEGEMKPWKRNLLQRLLPGRMLLVSGYSGRDFEICPELAALRADIVWNSKDDPRINASALTANARRVLNQSNGTVLFGSVIELLACLTNSAIDYGPAASINDLEMRLSDGLTEWDIAVWRLRTFVGIGAANAGIEYSDTVSRIAGDNPELQFHVLMNRARCYFHAGKYKVAANSYSDAAQLGEQHGRRDWVISALLDLVESQRCYGSWFTARAQLRDVESMLNPDEKWLKAQVALREVLLLRYVYQFVSGVRIVPWLVSRLRSRCKELLKSVVDSARDGHWLELQQAELWASRLMIPFTEIYSGPMTPPPSKDGYQQLGYVIAESMSLRDQIKRNSNAPLEFDPGEMITSLQPLGAQPELWKLVWVLLRKRGWDALTSSQRGAGWRAWWQTEYTLPMRAFVLFFH